MRRRDFFRYGSLAFVGTAIPGRKTAWAHVASSGSMGAQARNIIFMVSDGMSTGTLNMANLLLKRKEGRQGNWLNLYQEQQVTRALMDTASASSLVTDSAAASSSWGGGVRVQNGSLNVGADGAFYQPILQKFREAGKAVGCVTTVPITHATPAGFCINNNKRGDQEEIALQYLSLKFDVMMGGGLEYFSAGQRKDKQDLFALYRQQGYTVASTRSEMQAATGSQPLLGVFSEGGLPYSLDQGQQSALQQTIPTLAEMTHKTISLLKHNKKGFVMQVEAGKVDWAAHANDVGALLYDQLAFDEAIKVAIEFAAQDKQTLVIITTDHGNANPGLFYGDKANKNFDNIQQFKQTNDWILNGIDRHFTARQVIERIEYAQGLILKEEQAQELLRHYTDMDESGIYNPRKLPYKYLAQLQTDFTSVGWGSMDHSADYVELAMYGPGSELLKPFVKNTDLHYLMLEACGIKNEKS
jgi:alkaline phosphatase